MCCCRCWSLRRAIIRDALSSSASSPSTSDNKWELEWALCVTTKRWFTRKSKLCFSVTASARNTNACCRMVFHNFCPRSPPSSWRSEEFCASRLLNTSWRKSTLQLLIFRMYYILFNRFWVPIYKFKVWDYYSKIY